MALFHISQESTRKLAASIFVQSQYSKVYFNEMQALAASLQVGFAITGKSTHLLHVLQPQLFGLAHQSKLIAIVHANLLLKHPLLILISKS